MIQSFENFINEKQNISEEGLKKLLSFLSDEVGAYGEDDLEKLLSVAAKKLKTDKNDLQITPLTKEEYHKIRNSYTDYKNPNRFNMHSSYALEYFGLENPLQFEYGTYNGDDIILCSTDKDGHLSDNVFQIKRK